MATSEELGGRDSSTTTDPDTSPASSLPTTLAQLEQERLGQLMTTAAAHSLSKPRPPPLAYLEEFSEDNGMLTEDEVGSNMPSSEDMLVEPYVPQPPHDNDHMESAGGVNGGELEGRGYNSKPHAHHNGPISKYSPSVESVGVGEHTTIDMNGNGYHQHKHGGLHQWLDQKIESTLDLEKIFLENGGEESEDSDMEGEWDLLDFAERYYNVHTTNTGYTGAISKTVNMVRKKSNSVSRLTFVNLGVGGGVGGADEACEL